MNENNVEIFLVTISAGIASLILFIFAGSVILNCFKIPAPVPISRKESKSGTASDSSTIV